MAKPHDVENRYCTQCRITTKQFVTTNGFPQIFKCMRCGTAFTVARIIPQVSGGDGEEEQRRWQKP